MAKTNVLPWKALSAAAALTVSILGAPVVARAADEPAAATKPGARWTLGLTHGALKRILVDDGSGRRVTHFYMTMKVTNATGLPRSWRPLVVGTTDTLHPPYVACGFAPALDEIRRVEGDRTLEPVATSGAESEKRKIANGETKNLVAIFGPVDPEWSKFRVEIQGLVSPFAILKVQKYRDGKTFEDGRFVVSDTVYIERNERLMDGLREEAKKSGSEVQKPTPAYLEVVENRAWIVEYHRSGDEFRPDDDPIRFVRERWEVLGDPKIIRELPSKI